MCTDETTEIMESNSICYVIIDWTVSTTEKPKTKEYSHFINSYSALRQEKYQKQTTDLPSFATVNFLKIKKVIRPSQISSIKHSNISKI